MPPGRRTVAISPVSATTVLSTPTSHAPPSRISGMRPSISSSMCAASVGLGRPERLPLGAAMGRPHASISARATGCEGMRMATLSSPAVTTAGTISFLGRIIVSGPGQKAAASLRAISLMWHSGSISASAAMCTISGLSAGRSLAAKILRTAGSLSAFAPRPYTVSVGKPTISPARSSCAAWAMLALSAGKQRVRIGCASVSCNTCFKNKEEHAVPPCIIPYC